MPVSAAEQEALIQALCAYINININAQQQEGGEAGGKAGGGQGAIAAVAVMGSLPTGVAPGYYAKVRLERKGEEATIAEHCGHTHAHHSTCRMHAQQVLGRIWPPLSSLAPLLFLDTVIGLDALLALRLPVAMLKVRPPAELMVINHLAQSTDGLGDPATCFLVLTDPPPPTHTHTAPKYR